MTLAPKQPRDSRRAALKAGSLVLLLGVQEIARGASIMAVRVWPATDYTRVTIESDAALVAQQFFVSSPPRLAVDIDRVPALAEDREAQWRAVAGADFLTGEEKRALLGLA